MSKEEDIVLRNFVEELIPFEDLLAVGFFTEEMRGDYRSQAEKVRKHFGFESVYEYGARGFVVHVSNGDGTGETYYEKGIYDN